MTTIPAIAAVAAPLVPHAVVQDAFLHDLFTHASPDQQAAFQKALDDQLRETATAGVTGWTSQHEEWTAFPGHVNKASAKWSPFAAQQLATNKATVIGMLTNPTMANMMLMGIETAMNPTAAPINHDVADPDFQKFFQALCKAGADGSNFTFYGTLVNVGWGSGDHTDVTSEHLPAGPHTVADHLANSATRTLFNTGS